MRVRARVLASALILLVESCGASQMATSQRIPFAGDNRARYEEHLGQLALAPRSTPAELHRAARYLREAFFELGVPVTEQWVDSADLRSPNLIAELTPRRRTDDSVIVIGAHYDTVPSSPGADDNASGVAALLVIAEELRQVERTRTIRFIAFTYEESGLRGSQAYVESLSTAERERIRLYVNLDMIGYYTEEPGSQQYPAGAEMLEPGRVLRRQGDFIGALRIEEDPPALFQTFAASAAATPELHVEWLAVPRGFHEVVPDLLRGDHAPFWLADVPIISVTDTAELRTPHYHQASDVPSTVDIDFALAVTRWIGRAVAGLAGGASPELTDVLPSARIEP